MTKIVRERMDLMKSMGLAPRLVRYAKSAVFEINVGGAVHTITSPLTPSDHRSDVKFRAHLRRIVRNNTP
jgi:hypothetical protein